MSLFGGFVPRIMINPGGAVTSHSLTDKAKVCGGKSLGRFGLFSEITSSPAGLFLMCPQPNALPAGLRNRPEWEAVNSQLVVPASGFWIPDMKLGGWLQTSGPGFHGLDVELASNFGGPHSGSGLQVGSGI